MGRLSDLQQVQGFFMTPATKAAATQLMLVADPALDRTKAGGKYFVDGKPTAPSKEASDAATAARLWEMSEQMTGITFNPAS